MATRAMPKNEENSRDKGGARKLLSSRKFDNFLINRANFSTTNPNAIMAMLILTQARKVLSLAM